MNERLPPPPVLNSARVLAYAYVDDIPYRRSGALYVDGKLLEAVPRLAICINLGEEMGVLLFHCDWRWEVLGVSGRSSVEEVKQAAEKNYPGVGSRWVDIATGVDAAFQYYDSEPHNAKCSFCGRRPFELGGYIENAGARICYDCVERLYTIVQERRQADANEG